jgi:hypothetical protein
MGVSVTGRTLASAKASKLRYDASLRDAIGVYRPSAMMPAAARAARAAMVFEGFSAPAAAALDRTNPIDAPVVSIERSFRAAIA